QRNADASLDEILQLRRNLLFSLRPFGSRPLATAPHGARLAVGSFPRLLRGHVNRLARLAKSALCGWWIPHGQCGGAGSPASLHTGSPCRFLRCTVWRMRGADTGFACSTLNQSACHLLPPKISEARNVMTSREHGRAFIPLVPLSGSLS